LERKEEWRKRTNRADYGPVDYPTYARGRRPREPSRKEERRRKRKRPVEERPRYYPGVKSELQRRADVFTEKMHMPPVKVRTMPSKGYLRSRFRSRVLRARYGPVVGPTIVKQEVFIGTKGARVEKGRVSIPKLAIGALYHELGHAAHEVSRYSPRTKTLTEPTARTVVGKGFSTEHMGRYERERVAWAIGRESITKMPKPAAIMWLKRYALGGYKKAEIV